MPDETNVSAFRVVIVRHDVVSGDSIVVHMCTPYRFSVMFFFIASGGSVFFPSRG